MWLVGIIIAYIVIQVIFVIGVIYLVRKFDKRTKLLDSAPPGFERTEEVNIDPVSKIKTRVYYEPSSGKRVYVIEKEPTL